jgi:MoaA/NifB/PqqE/SkfB family radical SAM enzyme
MAKIQAKMFDSKRIPLQDVAPRKTPFSIEIDPSSSCNLKCNFCFRSDKEAVSKSCVKFGRMDFDLYKKCIEDIKQFPEKPTKLRLSGFGEPLMNIKYAEMIKYAKDNNVADKIECISNGILLNPELNRNIVEAGLDRINISIESMSRKGYYDVTGVYINFEKFINNIKDLYDNRKNTYIYVKIIDLGNFTKKDEEIFYNTFKNISDQMFIEKAAKVWNGTTANDNIKDTGIYGQCIPDYKKVCTFLFSRMSVNYDGKCSLCCIDWQGKEIIGDVKKESLYDIWNGKKLKNIQLVHLFGQRESIPLCKNCTVLSTMTIDNIDDYVEEIIERY